MHMIWAGDGSMQFYMEQIVDDYYLLTGILDDKIVSGKINVKIPSSTQRVLDRIVDVLNHPDTLTGEPLVVYPTTNYFNYTGFRNFLNGRHSFYADRYTYYDRT